MEPPYGLATIGLWDESSKASPSDLCVQSARQNELCAVGTQSGNIRLYRFPSPVEGSRSKVYFGHGMRVSRLCWVGRDAYLLSADAGHGDALLQWRMVDPRRSPGWQANPPITLGTIGSWQKNSGLDETPVQRFSRGVSAQVLAPRVIAPSGKGFQAQTVASEGSASIQETRDMISPRKGPASPRKASNQSVDQGEFDLGKKLGNRPEEKSGARQSITGSTSVRPVTERLASRTSSLRRGTYFGTYDKDKIPSRESSIRGSPQTTPPVPEPGGVCGVGADVAECSTTEIARMPLLFRASRAPPPSQRPSSPESSRDEDSAPPTSTTASEDRVRVKLVTIPVARDSSPPVMDVADAVRSEVEALRRQLDQMHKENNELAQRNSELENVFYQLGSSAKTGKNGVLRLESLPGAPLSARIALTADSAVQKMPNENPGDSPVPVPCMANRNVRSVSPPVVSRLVSMPNPSVQRQGTPSCDPTPRSTSMSSAKASGSTSQPHSPLRQISVPMQGASAMTPRVAYPAHAWSAQGQQTVVNAPLSSPRTDHQGLTTVPASRRVPSSSPPVSARVQSQRSVPSMHTASAPIMEMERMPSGSGYSARQQASGQGAVTSARSHCEVLTSGAVSSRSSYASCGPSASAPTPLIVPQSKRSPLGQIANHHPAPTLPKALSFSQSSLLAADLGGANFRSALRWQSGEPVFFALMRGSTQMAQCLLLHECLPPSNVSSIGDEHFTVPLGWAVCRSRRGKLVSIRLFADGPLSSEVNSTSHLSNVPSPNGDAPPYTISILGLTPQCQDTLRLSLSLAPLGVSDATEPLRIPSADVGLFVPNGGAGHAVVVGNSNISKLQRRGLWVGLRCPGSGISPAGSPRHFDDVINSWIQACQSTAKPQ
eukprot:gnl/MRDRNA2_/MRDRNA2_81432_c0_seq1.p1 gnl/MRDRNA2_/MRDRNA2_81432_c0~~gnl/MRDRNA2_/MRDRNA2_81432_c0_seq1.p1  ORF type:complete len:886 (+),score=121.81 gnl/MRDRNA2_/MRDRNA2_81432_c0_seq1:2101-4758(+)